VTVPALADTAKAAGDGLEIIVVGRAPIPGTVPYSSLLADSAAPAPAIDPTSDLVADAAVIGLPAGADGEVPKGFVVLATPAPLDEISSYLAEPVAPYKKLRALEAVTEIPRSATGKILRRVLKERPTG
jgi:acyl-CoA synthetase (AMP-forming)/AMP-acid ligase II